ncbi:MAG TPA: EAL domain-containing protein [Rhodocyclaceae bacterium]|nr:EAL domain-containing protein [Rhodocyclaceae bacterium]
MRSLIGRLKTPPLLGSVRRRMLVVGAAATLPILALMGYQAHDVLQENLHRQQADVHRMLIMLGNELNFRIQLQERLLEVLARAPEVTDPGDRAACGGALARTTGGNPFLSEITLRTPDGALICSSAASAAPRGGDAQTFSEVLRTKQPVISDFRAGALSNRKILLLAIPVPDGKGKPRSVLTADLDLTFLDSALQQLPLATGTQIVLVDGRGKILAPLRWAGQALAAHPAFAGAALGGGKRVFAATSANGEDQLYAAEVLPATFGAQRFRLWVATSKTALARAAVREFIGDTMNITAVMLVLIIVLWWYGSRLVLRPLARLAEAASHLGEAQLSARTGLPHSGDEIGRLAAAFDAMAERLEAHVSRIAADLIEIQQAGLKAKKLSQAVEQSPVSVVITDTAGTIEYVNPKFTASSGYSPEEAIGRTPVILKSGLTPTSVYKDLWNTVLAGKEWQGELLNRKKNGELFWEDTRVSPLSGDDGAITHFIVVKEDITGRKAIEEKLRKLSLAVEHSPVSVMITDHQGMIEYVNPRFTEVTGFAANEVFGKTPRVLKSGSTAQLTYQELWSSITAGRGWSGELQNRNRMGELFWESENIAPIVDGDGRITHFVALKEDITERKHTEERLRLLTRAMESSSNGIMVLDALSSERTILYVNPAFREITGYAEDSVLGKPASRIFGLPAERNAFDEIGAGLEFGDEHRAVVHSLRADGSRYWNEFSISPVRSGIGAITHYVGVINDVTVRVDYEKQLAHQANHDDLTGLANRNLLSDRLDQALAQAHRYGHHAAVLMVDLDHFKYINDSLGHAAGDQLVKTVADRLSLCVREGDTVARTGGDEFVLILHHVKDETDVTAMMQRIVATIAAPFFVEERELHVTCSTGAALYPRDGKSAEHLLRNADTAMYRAKEGGRDGFSFYTSDMNERMMERLSLEGGLRQALANEEFVLHYQPQVDIRTGHIVGAEALIRWQNRELGTVPPGKFIPLAEETGLIEPIGEWVMRTACAQNKRWQDSGLPRLRVAVNLSARQFRQKDFVARVSAILAESRLAAGCLEFELTESMVMHDPEQAVKLLHELKATGTQLSLDDFGTGYSSLSYLKKFPIDVLKLDQSFVRGVLTDPDDAAIARTVIGLGHSLGLRVIAEGVETAEQLDFLAALGCDEMQGYYFSRPVAAQDFAALLARHEEGGGRPLPTEPHSD